MAVNTIQHMNHEIDLKGIEPMSSAVNILVCCTNRFTSLCKNLFNLLEFLAEAFRCHVHHFQYLMVPVELAAMFRFIVVGIAEMLLWLLCLIVSKGVWDL